MIEPRDTAAILLAAGSSSRFGDDDKLLADLGGKPLALHAAEMLAGLAPERLLAVCRAAEGILADRLRALGFTIIVNPDPALGMSRSLALGIAEAARGSAQAALIALADMPFVTEKHARTLLDRFDPVAAPVVGSSDGSAAMPPAVFARAMFDRLRSASGDRGGRGLLADAALVTADPGMLADIDRPGDIPGNR